MPAPAHILYVDDNHDSCELVGLMLRYSNLSCEVMTAENAETAVSLMNTQNFNLFILDYALPVVSGVELCQQIRECDPKTPILFFTAMAGSANRARALAAGANEYLVKPDDLERLAETVERLLHEKAAVSCLVPVGM
jgi:DNA-binding response OmpR family regulator